KESELNYLNMKREIRLEVRMAYINLRTAAERVKLSEKQVEGARESYEVALGRYELGVAPITEVIDAQVAFSRARVNYTRAIYDHLSAKAALDKAMGRAPYRR
ncbi:MAG TPA: TolC family protein, partial [Candidatus Latescibacteria bacterium]|nr:TolC family protein [Candidatus Latescibacterota bacterium]